MGSSGQWRRLLLALGAVLGVAIMVTGATSPAQANPSQQNKKITVPPWVTPELLSRYLLLQNFGLSEEAIWFELNTDASTNEKTLLTHQTVGHLGMYVSGTASPETDFNAAGGMFSAHGSGYGVVDTAGAVIPGTRTSSFHNLDGGGGISGNYDATSAFALSSSQRLILSGYFDYTHASSTYGAAPGLAGVGLGGAGSANTNAYSFAGSFLYTNNSTYLNGLGLYSFGNGTESQTFDGSSGNFTTSGYALDLRLGNIFTLINTMGSATQSAMPTKAPPKAPGGYIAGLDLSGHIGYVDDRANGFTDTAGFVFGTEEAKYTDLGGRAKLFALFSGNGYMWEPYVAGTIDQRMGFSSTLSLPAQAALPTGDLVGFQEANTFWGGEFGLDVRGAGGVTVGLKGFVEASSDITVAGGSAVVKIPFNYTPTVAARY